jgi:hypothetical protein
MFKLILFIILFIGNTLAKAQTWEIGGFLGSSGYMGDINPIRPQKFTNFAYGAQFKRNFDGYWSAKIAYMNGKIQGDDAKSSNVNQRDRNLSFYSNLSELSLQVEFNFFKYLAGDMYSYGNKRFSPYLFTGGAFLSFEPMTNYLGEKVALRLAETEAVNYKNKAISIPYGIGIKYNIMGNFNIIGEIGYRTAFTDYLDDISGRYPDFSVIPIKSPISQALSDRSDFPKVGFPGTQRGDFRPRDTYMFAGITLSFTFVPIQCPTF